MRRWPPEKAWRRRADLNTLGLCVLLVLMAFLFAVGQGNDRAIQASRVDIARDNCRSQNARHDKTIRKLDSLIADIPPGSRKRRALAGRAATVTLIDALAPKRDCKALVEQIRSAAN